MMALGDYLRQLREQHDLSVREFAKKLDCSAAFVSDVELGRRYPSEKMLSDMAQLLGTTIAELKSHDLRPPTEDLKRMITKDSTYAMAFRTIVDKEIPADKLLDFAKKAKYSKK